MKILLIVLLVIVVMIIAFGVNSQYVEKYYFYVDLKDFVSQYKLNLNFKQEKIKDFLNKFKSRKSFKYFVLAYQNFLNTNQINLTDLKILEEDELNELENIIKNFGCFDVKTELKQIDETLVKIDNRLKQATEQRKKICPLIVKLSLLFAVGLALILI